ncbi:sugar ABC transporter substrate-binding protein [Bacillus sp. J14TS2]|uniref:sugar ABC transporter substrate-binding protein n=1 Tax=Bacillus sp. J14TS2 TaxID=2807188 RepID=UPI001B1E4236|nr:sugar ABC transporter substrate-binding protein [Bacillus sp. J14TS2]GIN71554.1 sugar ABC transporter substrate-binding protein [Bacillus sp. J14TS2]
MKKMNIKLFTMIMLCAILILGACGGNQDSSDKEGGKSSKTLKVWQMGDSGWNEIIGPYEEETGVDVQIQGIPWDSGHDKLLTAVASGKGPDIILMGTTWMHEFVDANTFVDLTDYLDEYPNLAADDFYDGALEASVFDGKTYGIPWHVDTRVLFYRKDLLSDVGYPDGPETWDDLEDAAKQLVASDKGKYAVDLPPKDINLIYPFAWEQGWDYDPDMGADNFTKPEFKKTVELYKTFYENKYSQIEKGKEMVQAFEDGSKPMFFSGPWDIKTIEEGAPDLDGKWDVRLMPDGGTNRSIIGGSQITIFKNSDNVDQALDFINWLSDPETQLAWYKEKNELPSRKEAWEDPLLAEDPMFSVFGEQLESVEASPTMHGSDKIAQEITKMIEKVARGGEDIDKALNDLHQKVEKILKD